MQLLVLALLLLSAGGKADLKEFKPIIESLGGDTATRAFKQAEELSGIVTALQSVMPRSNPPRAAATAEETPCDCGGVVTERTAEEGCFPLAPVAKIADERITYCLSRYIALGE